MNSMKKHIPFFVRHKQNILFESYWNYYTIETTDLLLEKKNEKSCVYHSSLRYFPKSVWISLSFYRYLTAFRTYFEKQATANISNKFKSQFHSISPILTQISHTSDSHFSFKLRTLHRSGENAIFSNIFNAWSFWRSFYSTKLTDKRSHLRSVPLAISFCQIIYPKLRILIKYCWNGKAKMLMFISTKQLDSFRN